MAVKKIRIEYYQVVIGKKDEAESKYEKFNLENLIAKLDKLEHKDKMKDYYEDKARIDEQFYNKNTGYWFLKFVRMRQYNIPDRTRENEISEPMSLEEDEYIGENATALYDPINSVLVLQRNRDSLGNSGIEKYLNDIYNNEQYDIRLLPYKNENYIDKIKGAKSFQKITIRFAKTTNEKYVGKIGGSLQSLIHAVNQFDGNTATITVSMGNTKKKGLDNQVVEDTISDIMNNEGIVKGASVVIREREESASELIDLFMMKRHDFIDYDIEKRETVDFRKLSALICDKYNARKDALIESLK